MGRMPLVFAEAPKQEKAGPGFRIHAPGFQAHFGTGEIMLGSRKAKVRVTFPGANPSVEPQGFQKLGAKVNYLLGDQAGNWNKNLSLFQAIQYKNLYAGVDLVYLTADGTLKSEFHVKAGADPSAIAIRFEAESELTILDNGNLEIVTAQGKFEEQAPVSFQTDGSSKIVIGSRYVYRGPNEIGIELDEYDRSQPLTIDPVITFSSFLGGSGGDSITSMAIASDNTIFVAGVTDAPDFPTSSSRQSSTGGGVDGFVVHLSSNGSTILYSTYFGGRGEDRITSIKVDSSGKAFVAGCTTSSNFPTALPRQVALSGSRDAFVAGLSANGQTLVFSTYFGGAASECANGLALDGHGGVIIAGETTSGNFPVLSAYQSVTGGGTDGFLAKFTDTGTLVFSTYMGGRGDDRMLGIALDSGSNIYLTGSTTSSNFPTLTPIQNSLSGGMDAFVTKFNATGSALIYSTYLGGSGGSISLPEAGYAIAVGSAGNAYVGGATYSSNFPTSSPAQANYAGQGDGFVAKLNTAGTALDLSTFVGGTGLDMVLGIVVDADGGYQVTGSTQSYNLPVVNPFQATRGGGTDVLFGQYNASGSLRTLSYFGGSDTDAGLAIATDANSGTFLAGLTASANLPLKNPFQSFSVGSSSAFLVRLTDPPKMISVSPASSTGASKTFTFIASSNTSFAAIASVALLFNTSASAPNACYLVYNQGQNTIALASNAGTTFPSALAGSSTVLSNSQCSVPASQVTAVGSGQLLTITATINFAGPFDGLKNIYMMGQDTAGVTGTWQTMGTFRVVATPAAPTASVSPSSGSGMTGTFQFTFSDANGPSDLTTLLFLVNSGLNPFNSCYFAYDKANNVLALANDAATAWVLHSASQIGTLENSQCRIQLSTTTVLVNDTSIVLTLPITFLPGYAGAKNVYLYAGDSTGRTNGFSQMGTWTAINNPPTVLVSPSSSSGTSGTLQFVFSDVDGSASLAGFLVVINAGLNPINSCYFGYDRQNNTIGLANDAGTVWGAQSASQPGTIQNSQCQIQLNTNTVTTTDTSVILTLPITFSSTTPTVKNIYMWALDSGGVNSGFQLVGTRSIP